MFAPKRRDPKTREFVRCDGLVAVYTEMLLQVCRDYPGLPDPRSLSMHEIRFFYNGVRGELESSTRPRG